MLAGLFLVLYVVERWRAREADLARTTDQLARANELVSPRREQVAEQIAPATTAPSTDTAAESSPSCFSDIKGFTEIADPIEPEELSEILNEYFSEMTAIAERYG